MRVLLLALGILAAAGAVLLGVAWRGLTTPLAVEGGDRVFVVEPGEPLATVAARLARAGVISDGPLTGPRALVLYARAGGLDRQVKSGEYDLSPEMTPREVLEKIISGEVKTYPVTLPPGLNAREIAARLEEAEITRAVEFFELVADPEFARTVEVEADSLEGYLFPETYRFRRDTPPDEVARTMVEHFQTAWSDADRARLEASRWSLHEVVTLASIVEKETGAVSERVLIAAVFDNRLKRRMRLQSDPTVIYGILETRGFFDGNIRRSDLEADTPYNTYTRGGFPPGPIASPGMESIRAVLAPAEVDYLYFVSKNDGTHLFSSRLRDHNAAVSKYQKGK